LFEFGFFFVKQLFDLRALRRIGRDREHRPVVLDVLPNDKMLQDKPPKVVRFADPVDTDQCTYGAISITNFKWQSLQSCIGNQSPRLRLMPI
jgi:hypothetical protein